MSSRPKATPRALRKSISRTLLMRAAKTFNFSTPRLQKSPLVPPSIRKSAKLLSSKCSTNGLHMTSAMFARSPNSIAPTPFTQTPARSSATPISVHKLVSQKSGAQQRCAPKTPRIVPEAATLRRHLDLSAVAANAHLRRYAPQPCHPAPRLCAPSPDRTPTPGSPTRAPRCKTSALPTPSAALH